MRLGSMSWLPKRMLRPIRWTVITIIKEMDLELAEVPISASVLPMLLKALNDPGSSAARVGEVVASDAGLAARVLAVANSAAFGRARQVSEIHDAVALLGGNLVRTLAIAGSSRLLDGASGLPHQRDHAVATACAARLLAVRVGLPEADAFSAGLLHDIGEILLWHQDPLGYSSAYAGWEDLDSQLRGERGQFGADHATAAREQLTEWGLPGTVIDAVGDHHRTDLNHRDLSTLVADAEDVVMTANGADDCCDRLGIGMREIDKVCAELTDEMQDMSVLL
jgi:HD-like signal output (HDOD) protein